MPRVYLENFTQLRLVKLNLSSYYFSLGAFYNFLNSGA